MKRPWETGPFTAPEAMGIEGGQVVTARERHATGESSVIGSLLDQCLTPDDGRRLTIEFCDYVRELVDRGGPDEAEWGSYTRWVRAFDAAKREGYASERDNRTVLEAFGEAVSMNTMQGMVVQQSRGYAGDFELLERIYASWVSPDPHLANWDRYFHAQAAPKAVRNRKAYLHRLLDELRPGSRMLNLGSGPGRCVGEWLSAHPEAEIEIECVDMDPDALAYSRRLIGVDEPRVVYRQADVVRFRPDGAYDLVWAGGLFDYFNDRWFARITNRMMAAVRPRGELVIGNFAEGNPTRPYMELGNWRLYHRSPDDLLRLLSECECGSDRVWVDAEPEGVNLFVRATRAS